jgi:hypothetical protein
LSAVIPRYYAEWQSRLWTNPWTTGRQGCITPEWAIGRGLGYGLSDRESDMTPAARRAVGRAFAELKAEGFSRLPPDKQMHDRNRTYQLHYPDIGKARKPRR